MCVRILRGVTVITFFKMLSLNGTNFKILGFPGFQKNSFARDFPNSGNWRTEGKIAVLECAVLNLNIILQVLHRVSLIVNFPLDYPTNVPPTFTFGKGTTLDGNAR